MRTPRRHFATPLVLTVIGAAGSSGMTSCNPPPATRNPPPPDLQPVEPPADAATTPTTTNPAPPDTTDQTPPPPEPTYAAAWTVTKRNGGCAAMRHIECPKPAEPGGPVPTCNPPGPVKYVCPDGMAMDRPIEVVRYEGQDDCFVKQEPIRCPEGATCNPPPPQKVTCPSR
jgi:hypothetical protein